jgi:hypothetical protein
LGRFHANGRARLRLVGLVACVCASGACAFWGAGDWSNNFDSSTASVPPVLATGLDTPWGIVVRGETLYFATNVSGGGVYKCSVASCRAPTPLVTNLAAPARLAVDSENVYWTNFDDGTIDSCNINGCGGMPTTLASGQSSPIGIAIDTTNVYWVNSGTNGSVSTCPLTGCKGSPTVLSNTEHYPFDVAVDLTGVYWVNTYGSVRFCPRDGCGQGPTTLAQNQGNLHFITLSDGGIYWSNNNEDGGAVGQCSAAGCSPTEVAPSVDPAGVAVDGTGIYWVEELPGGSVKMCPLGGCGTGSPRVLATGQGTPFGIALDPAYVYFTDSTSGEIVRVPKP